MNLAIFLSACLLIWFLGGATGLIIASCRAAARRRRGWFSARFDWNEEKECPRLYLDGVQPGYKGDIGQHFLLALTKRKLTLLWKKPAKPFIVDYIICGVLVYVFVLCEVSVYQDRQPPPSVEHGFGVTLGSVPDFTATTENYPSRDSIPGLTRRIAPRFHPAKRQAQVRTPAPAAPAPESCCDIEVITGSEKSTVHVPRTFAEAEQ